jgi:SM-20-related protein
MTSPDNPVVANHALRTPALTPYIVRNNFLSPNAVHGLLDYARSNESRFIAGAVNSGTGATVNPEVRVSSSLPDLGPFNSTLKSVLRPLAAGLTAELRLQPFKLKGIELELVAHGDGAFYKRHIDTATSAPNADVKSIRIVSGVYYFHAQPKPFEGGALRLHQIMPSGQTALFVDVEPIHNCLVAFPSWMPHEVMPVRCPSGRFMDSRFAINCWFHRSR